MSMSRLCKTFRTLVFGVAQLIPLTLVLLTLIIQPTLASQESEFEMQIYDSFAITDKGTVVYGRVKTGVVTVGNTVCIPLTTGETVPRVVKIIERTRKLLERVEAGQVAGLFVDDLEPKLVAKGQPAHRNCELPTGG
jgi:translation elongation factor EF-Tu-like GTPase